MYTYINFHLPHTTWLAGIIYQANESKNNSVVVPFGLSQIYTRNHANNLLVKFKISRFSLN